MAQRRSGQERLGFVEPSRGASALEALSGLIDWEPVGRWPAPLLPGGDRVKLPGPLLRWSRRCCWRCGMTCLT